MDHLPDGYGGTGPWTGIVAVGDYGASLGIVPGYQAVVTAAYPTGDTDLNITGTQAPLIKESASYISSPSSPTNGFVPKNTSIAFGDITDGLSNTIAVFESAGRPFIYRRGALVDSSLVTRI